MNISKQNSPAFGSTVVITSNLKTAFNRLESNQSRQALLEAVETLKNDGKDRYYKLGCKNLDRDGDNYLLASLFSGSTLDVVPRLYVKVAETVKHLGKELNIKDSFYSNKKVKDVNNKDDILEVVFKAVDDFKAKAEKAKSKLSVKMINEQPAEETSHSIHRPECGDEGDFPVERYIKTGKML